MGIQNFTSVLKQAIAHTGHAAADDDDFRIVQAENGAQTVAKQFSGFLHGLNGNSIPVIVGTGKHVCSDLIKVIIYPVTDDAVLSQLDFFTKGAQNTEGRNIACKNIRKDLKLSDRIFKCACGYIEDRDLNAALNLRDAMTYEVA